MPIVEMLIVSAQSEDPNIDPRVIGPKMPSEVVTIGPDCITVLPDRNNGNVKPETQNVADRPPRISAHETNMHG